MQVADVEAPWMAMLQLSLWLHQLRCHSHPPRVPYDPRLRCRRNYVCCRHRRAHQHQRWQRLETHVIRECGGAWVAGRGCAAHGVARTRAVAGCTSNAGAAHIHSHRSAGTGPVQGEASISGSVSGRSSSSSSSSSQQRGPCHHSHAAMRRTRFNSIGRPCVW